MAVSFDTSAGLAIDTQALGQLRAQARQSPEKALKAAAQQFEAVFINMMLKSMRDATPQDDMMDSEQTRMFTGMLDQQLAQNMSARGIGLAEIMVRQLSLTGLPVSGTQPSASSVSGSQFTVDNPQSLPAPQASRQAGATSNPSGANIRQAFVDRMLPYALQAASASGVPPQLMLGQAALESGWGRREILLEDGGNSYNLFGIKANSDWHGRVAEVLTTEYKDGVASRQVEKFRAYSSYDEAFRDYASMLSSNPRYATVLKQTGDPAGMAQALQKSGYATDPKYADKLAGVIKKIDIVG